MNMNISPVFEDLVYRRRHSFKCTRLKWRMRQTNQFMVNGLGGMTTSCVTRPGHDLDGK